MAKTPTPTEKPTSAIDAPPATPPAKPWAQPTTEPPAGTPLTAEELAANGITTPAPETPAAPIAAPETEPVSAPAETVEPAAPAVPPVEDKLTLEQTPSVEPTGDDGRPDGFIPGDQTAADALTPPGGRHPGAPRGLLPGQPINLQDPHNVNGTQRNQELLAMGHGIKNPLLDKAPSSGAAQADADEAKG